MATRFLPPIVFGTVAGVSGIIIIAFAITFLVRRQKMRAAAAAAAAHRAQQQMAMGTVTGELIATGTAHSDGIASPTGVSSHDYHHGGNTGNTNSNAAITGGINNSDDYYYYYYGTYYGNQPFPSPARYGVPVYQEQPLYTTSAYIPAGTGGATASPWPLEDPNATIQPLGGVEGTREHKDEENHQVVVTMGNMAADVTSTDGSH